MEHQGLKESGCRSAIYGLMVNRQAQGKTVGISHFARRRTLGLEDNPSDPKYGYFRGIQNRRESLDAEHSEVSQGKGPTGKIIR